MNQWAELGLNILEALSPAILALLAWLGLKLSHWLRAKISNELVGGMLARLNDSVFTAVKAIEQTVVREIKAAKEPNSPGGPKITTEEADRVKKAAIDALKSYWGVKGLAELGEVLGLTGDGLNNLLESKVEAAVHDLKVAEARP